MKRLLCVHFGVILISGIAAAQDAAPPAAFEAADVHVSSPGALSSRGVSPGGRLEFHGQTMLDLVTFAFNLERDSISGGPAWIDSDHFDITAKSSALNSQDALHAMFKALLADR